MPNSAVCTVSGKTGPAVTATSRTFSNVTAVFYDIVRGVVEILYGSSQRAYFDYNQTTTVTMTISGTVTTVTIS